MFWEDYKEGIEIERVLKCVIDTRVPRRIIGLKGMRCAAERPLVESREVVVSPKFR